MDVLDNWCKRVETSLLRLDAIPPLGNAPEFPWDSCAKKFSEAFDNIPCEMKAEAWKWRFEEDLLERLPKESRVLELAAAPLSSPVYFVTDVSSMERLTTRLMSGRSDAMEIPLPQLKEAFTTYTTLEAIHLIGTFPSMQGLSPKLIHPLATPQGNCLGRDIRITCDNIQLSCRLLLTEAFVAEVEKHFQPVKSPLSLKSSKVADSLELVLNIEVGKTELSQSDWESMEAGDFLRLDSCSIDPTTNTGSCSIQSEGNHLFSAKVSPKGLEITSS